MSSIVLASLASWAQTPVIYGDFRSKIIEEHSFQVIPNPFKSDVAARWLFSDTRSGGSVHTLRATLHLENNTAYALRFSYPGFDGNIVRLNIKDFHTNATTAVNIPVAASIPDDPIPCLLPTGAIACFGSAGVNGSGNGPRKMIILATSGVKDIPIDLSSGYPFQSGHGYEVMVKTVVTVDADQLDNRNAKLFPMRIPAIRTVRLTW